MCGKFGAPPRSRPFGASRCPEWLCLAKEPWPSPPLPRHPQLPRKFANPSVPRATVAAHHVCIPDRQLQEWTFARSFRPRQLPTHRDFGRLGYQRASRRYTLVHHCTMLNIGAEPELSWPPSVRTVLYSIHTATSTMPALPKRLRKNSACFSLLIRLYFRQLYA